MKENLEEKVEQYDESKIRRVISELLDIRRELVRKIRKATPENIEDLRRAYDNVNYKLMTKQNQLNENYGKQPETFSINYNQGNKPKMQN